MVSHKGWKQRFIKPIPLADGGTLATLEDAWAHILSLPQADQNLERWQHAKADLMLAAEQGRDFLFLANFSMRRALGPPKQGSPDPKVRKPNRKRDQDN